MAEVPGDLIETHAVVDEQRGSGMADAVGAERWESATTGVVTALEQVVAWNVTTSLLGTLTWAVPRPAVVTRPGAIADARYA
ncbi:MAG: hypothetical protein ABIO99_02170 [Candidatus Limnocylindria bacterium]